MQSGIAGGIAAAVRCRAWFRGALEGRRIPAASLGVCWVLAALGWAPAVAQTFEAGLLEAAQADANQWHAIYFDRPFAAPPVVVLGPLDTRNGQGAVLRVRHVTSDGFEFQIDEWDYLDGRHPAEQLCFLALPEGVQTISGVRWQAGRVPAVGREATAARFPQAFASAPVVLVQAEGGTNASAVGARVRAVKASGFKVFLQSEEANAASPLAGETVAFAAVETGSGSIGALAFEAAIGPDRVRRPWQPVAFLEPAPRPVLLAGFQTCVDTDPAVLRMRALTPTGVELRADEEQSADTERRHGGERVGYLVISGEVVQQSESEAQIEFGEISAATTATTRWHGVDFARTYERPVVVAGPLSNHNGAPAGVRLRNVTGTGFEFKIEEWDYLAPGTHPVEQFSYLAIEDGLYEIDGVRLEAGRVENARTTAAARYFTQEFRSQPVVLPQLAGEASPDAAVVRATTVNPLAFGLRLAEEEAADGVHAPEVAHYIAIEPGAGGLADGTVFSAGHGATRFGGGWRTLDFGGNFLEPYLFAAVQSDREADPFHLRFRDLTGFAVSLRLREEASLDAELTHRGEDLGYLVLRGGTDSDADGLPDAWELAYGLDPDNPADAGSDGDADGLTALEEFEAGTSPNLADTDGDGLLDLYEWLAGSRTNRSARPPFKPRSATGLVVYTPEPRPVDPVP